MFYAYANRLGAYKPGLDPDAAAYIAAVETADGQALESGVRKAINNFVVGCKSDGIWDAIKASCILAGARTLDGALVPLVGTAPTSNNFVSGDYNRETGLVGNGSTKRIDSNRANNADPQTNAHIYCYVTAVNATVSHVLMGSTNETGARCIRNSGGTSFQRYLNSAPNSVSATSALGGAGLSRSSSPAATSIWGSITQSYSQAVATILTENIHIFAQSNGGSYSNARLSFYSIGESLDLAKLDSRVSTLMTELTAAIP
jgi:hypothetical protein